MLTIPGAHSWISCGNDNLKALTDTQNQLIYQMHQYLDTDNSGTHAECVSSTIFQERLVAATNWLRTNKKQGTCRELSPTSKSMLMMTCRSHR